MWFKRGIVPVGNQSGTERMLFNAYQDSSNQDQIWLQSNGTINYVRNNANAVTPSQVLRDSSAWYHVVFAGDTTQGSNADRLKVYINGTQAPIGQQDTITQNSNFGAINNAQLSTFGRRNGSNDWYFDGSMANVEMVDGQQLTPAYFGSTDSNTGIWKPGGSSAISNYGTNGYKLKMDTTSPGADTSGKGNTFTPSGTPTLLQGSPSNVYATLNPLFRTAGATYSNGNTTYAYANNYQRGSLATIAPSGTNKFYFEWKPSGNFVHHINLVNETLASDGGYGLDVSNNATYRMSDSSNQIGWNTSNNTGELVQGGSTIVSGLPQVNSTDVGQLAFDCATGKMWAGKDGTWHNSGNPATGANPTYTWTNTYTPGNLVWLGMASEGGATVYANFGEGFFGTTAAGTQADDNGQGLFAYDVPAGYYALNTKNLEAYG